MARRRRREWTFIHSRGGSAGGGESGDPNWANVSLLLPFNGADAATSTLDLSNTGHSITFGGGAQLDTAVKKFGTASCLFDGSGDYLQILSHADFSFGSGDYTIEMHAELDSATGYYGLITRNASSNFEWELLFNTGTLIFRYSTTGAAWVTALSTAWSPTINTFYHIAVCRDGANLRVFIDGTQVGSTYNCSTDTIYNGGSPIEIGQDSGPDWLAGHMDNIRITKGVARYTANFTAPTVEYPTS
jgi:hypothetical protein